MLTFQLIVDPDIPSISNRRSLSAKRVPLAPTKSDPNISRLQDETDDHARVRY